MDVLNKKIASLYKLLAIRNHFLNKEVQHLHFWGLRIMPLNYDPVLIVVKLSCISTFVDQTHISLIMICCILFLVSTSLVMKCFDFLKLNCEQLLYVHFNPYLSDACHYGKITCLMNINFKGVDIGEEHPPPP